MANQILDFLFHTRRKRRNLSKSIASNIKNSPLCYNEGYHLVAPLVVMVWRLLSNFKPSMINSYTYKENQNEKLLSTITHTTYVVITVRDKIIQGKF